MGDFTALEFESFDQNIEGYGDTVSETNFDKTTKDNLNIPLCSRQEVY